MAAQERPGTSEEEGVDGRSRYEQTVVTTTKEAALPDCGHVVTDSANEITYQQPQSLAPGLMGSRTKTIFIIFLFVRIRET